MEAGTAPASPEAGEFESRRQGGCLELSIVALFRLGGRHVADRLEGTAVVVPVHPVEGGVLDRLERAPRAAPPDHLGLEQANDGLGERIVVAAAGATGGGFDTGFKEPLCVPNRNILPTPVAVVDEAAPCGTAVVQRLL